MTEETPRPDLTKGPPSDSPPSSYPPPAGYPPPPSPSSGYPPPGGQPQGYPSYPSQPGYPGYPGGSTPPPYGYGAAFGAPERNGMSVAALVLGIIGIFPLAGFFVPNVLAFVFGLIGLGRARRGESSKRGFAITGIVLGVVGLVLSVIVVIYIVHNFHQCGQSRCDDGS